MYKVIWQPKAVRQIEKINDKKLKIKLFSAVDGLTNFPNCQNVKYLINHKCDYRLRVGRFRVLFNVKELVQIIDIVEIKKRDEQTY